MPAKRLPFLILGDLFAIVVITVIGFATHGELSVSFMARMLTTFLPLAAGWALLAPWLGLFDARIMTNPRQLWRAPLAMLLAAPLAGVLRAAMLNGAALPLFVAILGASAALGMLAWRVLWLILIREKKSSR